MDLYVPLILPWQKDFIVSGGACDVLVEVSQHGFQSTVIHVTEPLCDLMDKLTSVSFIPIPIKTDTKVQP